MVESNLIRKYSLLWVNLFWPKTSWQLYFTKVVFVKLSEKSNYCLFTFGWESWVTMASNLVLTLLSTYYYSFSGLLFWDLKYISDMKVSFYLMKFFFLFWSRQTLGSSSLMTSIACLYKLLMDFFDLSASIKRPQQLMRGSDWCGSHWTAVSNVQPHSW